MPSFAGPVSLPHPRTTSTLFFFIRNCEALGVLVHDALLALLDRAPVQRDAGGVLQPEFRAFLHVVEDFGVEQQRLGWNATDMQAGAAQVRDLSR